MSLSLAKVKVPEGESLKLKPAQDRTRDDDQKQIDSEVKTQVYAWHGLAGDGKAYKTPADVPVETRPVIRFAVPPDEKSDLKRYIRRACTLAKCEPVWFEDAEDSKGRSVVTFTFAPPRPKKKKEDTETTS